MPTDVVMPQMGESIFEGTITKWLKKRWPCWNLNPRSRKMNLLIRGTLKPDP